MSQLKFSIKNRLPRIVQIAGAVLVAGMCGAAEPAAHPFHVSMAEVEYNPKSRAMEVALKLYAVDAEQALRRIRSKDGKFDFDDEQQRDTLLKKYLPTRFYVQRGATKKKRASGPIDPVSGRALAPAKTKQEPTMPSFRYVGSEIDGAWVWAYFEVPVDLSRGQFELSNTVLNEIQLEQLNVVAFKTPRGRAQTIYFNRKKPVQTVKPTG